MNRKFLFTSVAITAFFGSYAVAQNYKGEFSKIELSGLGSKGDISGMTVIPNPTSPVNTIARHLADKTVNITPQSVKITGSNTNGAIDTTESTGSNIALRAGNGQLLCWGANINCLYHSEAFGLIWATPFGASSGATTKMLLDAKGNQTLTGNLFTPGIVSKTNGSASFSVNPPWAHGIPDLDVMKYANAIDYRTNRDGDMWESALGIDYISETGHNEPWVSGKSVAVGDNILGVTGNPEGYVYRVTKAGVLGGSSPTAGPKSAPFPNGTATLQWINYDNLAAKIPFTNTVLVRGNAGKTWLNNFNYSMQTLNNPPKYATNTEWNFSNASGYDCALFTGVSCGALTIFQGGPNISTSIIGMSPLLNTPEGSFASEWGITMKDKRLTRDASIDIATGGKMALGTGRYSFAFGTTFYSQAVWRDESTSPYAVSFGGNYTQAAIDLQSATAPVAVALKAGQKVCFYGNNNCLVKDNSQGKLLYKVNDVTVMSIADDGSVYAKSFTPTANP